MNLINTKPFPVKICFLKDEQKPIEEQKQEKLSVTFLSSFIQQQKHRLNNNNHGDIMVTSAPILNEQTYQQQTAHKTYGKTTYEKWRKKKSNSQSQDKRLLTNLIGADWANCKIYEQFDLKHGRRRSKKTIKDRVETIQDDERKKDNSRLMQNHFKTFLSNKKQKAVVVETQQSKCFTTKVDERSFPTEKPNFMINQSKQTNYRVRPFQLLLNQTKLRQDQNRITKNYISSGSDSATLRRGYKQMPNFKWSKLNNNEKFKLNDISCDLS